LKKRIDVLLVELGLAPSRERAQALIISGNVLVNDEPITKPGYSVDETLPVRVRGEDHPYVSRGGIKLAAALDHFGIPVESRVGLDLGASTGGFTHVLLLRGATKVFAVDVGQNQLDWKIRNDPRVAVFEKVNARYLEFGLIGRKVDLIVADLSFISLDKVLPAAVQFAHAETDWITLIKPQFEVGRELVGKGGLVTNEEARRQSAERLARFGETIGLRQVGLIESPITGTQGNKEFLAHWKLIVS
jgi:23S rRNA (cytidine1920-2'-O)/16S rRNA (cytidine1409-2'-O)-methyltransferase